MAGYTSEYAHNAMSQEAGAGKKVEKMRKQATKARLKADAAVGTKKEGRLEKKASKKVSKMRAGMGK